MGLFGRTKDPAPPSPPASGAAPAAGAVAVPRTSGIHRMGANASFTGELRFAGRLEFDARITGSLIAEPIAGSCLVIGPNGQVHGRIEAETIIINGQVQGPIRAQGRLDIQSSARVIGDIGYRDLQIQHGAVVEGALKSLDGQPVALKLVANSRR